MQEAEGKEETSANSVSKSKKGNTKPVDMDPNGEKLLQVSAHFYHLIFGNL